MEKRSNHFIFKFKSQTINVVEHIEVKSGYTGIFFIIDQDKNFFSKLDQNDVKEFIENYENSVWDLRKRQLGKVALEEEKFWNLCINEKKNRMGNISNSVLNFRKNWSVLKGFRGRMIFTIMSDELIGVTHIDLDADVNTIIKETNSIFLKIHGINTRYGEYTIQHTVRMFLDNFLRFAKILTIIVSPIPSLAFLNQVITTDFVNLENIIWIGITSGISAWIFKYGGKYVVKFIINRLKKNLFEKLM